MKLPRIAAAALLLALAAAAFLHLTPRTPTVQAAEKPSLRLEDPDRACAQCHQAIYASYKRTHMARGSGLAAEALIPGTFHHDQSGVDYRVFLRPDHTPVMSFSRPDGSLSGERDLALFVGSGHRGRTFLYQIDHRWFELPINFYTRRNAWAMAPAFDDATAMPQELPVDPGCLHCHASQIQTAEPTARNRFPSTPFKQGGIGCSACHGDPAQHLASGGRAPILNPDKLSASRRDSACIQCHLEGDAVVPRPGRSLAQFQPGDDLTDYAVYFVKSQSSGSGARATSQYEALLRSACKRASGDDLTCTTCHDPHSSPAPADRVQYFRQRCLACHTDPDYRNIHHPEQPDCAACHMPTRSTTDISHEQVTDHDIEAHPATRAKLAFLNHPSPVELVPVGDFHSDDRTLGLAYAQLAQKGDRNAAQKALQLLTQAATHSSSQPGQQPDPELYLRLGYLLQLAGQPAKARAAYSNALQADPYDPTALGNLAVLDAGQGRAPEAVHLLDRLITADPSQTAAGLNLAYIQCRLGHPDQALATARQLQPENPDNPQLRTFLATGTYAGQTCNLHPPQTQ